MRAMLLVVGVVAGAAGCAGLDECECDYLRDTPAAGRDASAAPAGPPTAMPAKAATGAYGGTD